MVASTSTVVPYATDEHISLLRAVLGRTSQEVMDYTVQYEDQVKLVEALGTAMNAPENSRGDIFGGCFIWGRSYYSSGRKSRQRN